MLIRRSCFQATLLVGTFSESHSVGNSATDFAIPAFANSQITPKAIAATIHDHHGLLSRFMPRKTRSAAQQPPTN